MGNQRPHQRPRSPPSPRENDYVLLSDQIKVAQRSVAAGSRGVRVRGSGVFVLELKVVSPSQPLRPLAAADLLCVPLKRLFTDK